MKRNILLGNGINIHLGVMGVREVDIAERFRKILIASSDFFELLFKVKITSEITRELWKRTEKRGIESLTSVVYDYVYNRRGEMDDNETIRLLDAIICCAITAIFYDGKNRLGSEYNADLLPDFSKYDNVYTLNYAECWDRQDICIYLHGQYKMGFSGKMPVLHYSQERFNGCKGYAEVVDKLRLLYEMRVLYTRDIVFSPEFYRKEAMMAIGAYPSENLYPADDFSLFKSRKLYEELDNVHEIEVFGMSPYGDADLIRKLNQMEKVTVYVYGMETSRETLDWDNVLTCSHMFRDSMDIMI